MRNGELLAYVIADHWQQSANRLPPPPLLPDLREQFLNNPTVVQGLWRWANRQCPICRAELLTYESEGQTQQWCAEDQYHFTLDRVARRLPDGNFEDRLHFDIDRAFDSQEVQPI